MASEFLMPSLGPDMESGTLVEWKIKPGDVVKRGDIVALVETDKGVIDVEIFASGTVTNLLVDAGTRVPVGTVLAQLDGAGEPAAPVAPTPKVVAPTPSIAPAPIQPSEPIKPEEHARQRVSPAARARAKQLGVDIAQVHGSGPHGAVTLEDVIAAARPAVAAVEPVHDMRQIIAKAMTRSKREIPHYYLSVTVDFSPAQSWIERYNATASIENRILPAAVLIKAVAVAAAAMPDFNGFYRNDVFTPSKDVHVGMAIAMRGGRLAAPALLDANQKPLAGIMNELRDLTSRVRAGHMRGSELSSPTITVTSLAEDGIDFLMPAIYPPQVAIIGFGSVVRRPIVVGEEIRAAPTVVMTLAADHRVTDGRAGAHFLARVREALLHPETL